MANLFAESLQLAVFKLPKEVRSENLKEWFGQLGIIYDAYVIPCKRDRTYNYGFVTMDRKSALNIVYFKKLEINGKRIAVKIASGHPSEHSQRIERKKHSRIQDASGKSRK